MKLNLRNILFAVLIGVTVPACGAVSGGGAAPSGGGSSPVAVELPNISVPTSISTNMGGFTATSGSESLKIALYKSISDPDFLRNTVPSGPEVAEQIFGALDTTMDVFGGMSCPRAVGTTTCRFFNTAGNEVKVDFSPFTFPAEFSANNTSQACNQSCVADTATQTGSTTSLCMQVWVSGTQYLIGKFNTVPVVATSTTGADKGAGCFIVQRTDSDGVVFKSGILYDKSNTLAVAVSGVNSELEMFVEYGALSDTTHFFATETGYTSEATQLVNFNAYESKPSLPHPLYYTARWFRDVNLIYGTYSQTNTSEITNSTDSPVCTDKSGNTATGCDSITNAAHTRANLTTPALPATLNASTSTDFNFPSLFSATPTF